MFGASLFKPQSKKEKETAAVPWWDTPQTLTAPPPMMPIMGAPIVRRKMTEMLLSCLRGGMSYVDAKECCSDEYGDELLIALKEDDEIKRVFNIIYDKWKEEFDARISKSKEM